MILKYGNTGKIAEKYICFRQSFLHGSCIKLLLRDILATVRTESCVCCSGRMKAQLNDIIYHLNVLNSSGFYGKIAS